MDISLIMKAPFFKGMDEEKVLAFLLSPQNARRSYPPKSFIAMQGDICRSLYLLSEGKVRTSMVNDEGKQLTIETLEAPLLLAPAFVFSMENRFPVNVEVVDKCEVFLINKELLLEFLHQNPVVMLNFIRLLSNRSSLLSQRLNQFALQDLKSRLLDYVRVHHSIKSQQEVAQILGVARPSLARALAELIEERKIKINGKEILVCE